MASRILSMWNDAISRARIFQSHGVTLKFPARSRSGVRDHDGVVVFAMEMAQVRVDDWGCSCLLWAPASRCAPAAPDRAGDAERLRHCRLARRYGMAEGFLVYGDETTVRREGTLSLRVLKVGKEYWAKWGCVSRNLLPRHGARASKVLL